MRAWLKIVKKPTWRNLGDVQRDFNSADIAGVHTIFNIKKNTYRIIAAIHYNRQRLYIREVFTHSEYDRWNKR